MKHAIMLPALGRRIDWFAEYILSKMHLDAGQKHGGRDRPIVGFCDQALDIVRSNGPQTQDGVKIPSGTDHSVVIQFASRP